MSKIRKFLSNQKGEAYIGAVVFVMIACAMTIFVLQMGGIVTTKVSLDENIKQIVKQAQLDGGISDRVYDTIQQVEARYAKDLNGDGDTQDPNESIKITLVVNDVEYTDLKTTRKKIQLGDSFTVRGEIQYYLGIDTVGRFISVRSGQIGVSEKYWKELAS